jgi:hypothetical protein
MYYEPTMPSMWKDGLTPYFAIARVFGVLVQFHVSRVMFHVPDLALETWYVTQSPARLS